MDNQQTASQEAQVDERAAFEEWADKQNYSVSDRIDDGYYWPAAQRAWEAWQARAALRSENTPPSRTYNTGAEQSHVAGTEMHSSAGVNTDGGNGNGNR